MAHFHACFLSPALGTSSTRTSHTSASSPRRFAAAAPTMLAGSTGKCSRRDFMILSTKATAALAVVFPANAADAPTATGIGSASGKVEPYQDTQKGFKILRPAGWNEFGQSEGFDVKWQDIIQPLEQITIITKPVTKGKKVSDLGPVQEVGKKLASSRKMELVGTSEREKDGVRIYTFELKSNGLHQLTVVTVAKSKLYSVNLSSSEGRWEKQEKLLRLVADSFTPRI